MAIFQGGRKRSVNLLSWLCHCLLRNFQRRFYPFNNSHGLSVNGRHIKV